MRQQNHWPQLDEIEASVKTNSKDDQPTMPNQRIREVMKQQLRTIPTVFLGARGGGSTKMLQNIKRGIKNQKDNAVNG